MHRRTRRRTSRTGRGKCTGLPGLLLNTVTVALHSSASTWVTNSRVRVAVEPTNEEWIAARYAQELMTAA